jgi:hypothetical protein
MFLPFWRGSDDFGPILLWLWPAALLTKMQFPAPVPGAGFIKSQKISAFDVRIVFLRGILAFQLIE